MSKRDQQRLAKLIKKTAGKPSPRKVNPAQYDDTLKLRPEEEDPETRRFFKEMRERDF